MNKIVKNLMIRVIKEKMKTGLTFDEIVAEYPKLTATEIAELKKAIVG